MYRFINFILLARVSVPFLSIYLASRGLKHGRGHLYAFWIKAQDKVPSLKDLDRPLQRRIFHYLFANSLTTQWFSTLLNYKPGPGEIETGYFIAMATPIADYLVDHEKMPVDNIHYMLEENSEHPWQNMARHLNHLSMRNHPSPDIGQQLIHLTLQAQEQSLKQHDQSINWQKLKEITWDKGGNALLLYRSALKPPINQDEWNAIYQLGGLMQLHNDIFDLYRDLQEGIQTIPSTTESITILFNLFESEIEKTYLLVSKLPYPAIQKRKFYLLLSLAVQTGFHALNQYSGLEEKYGSFTPQHYSREELVCDMDHLGKISSTVWATINKKHI